jgi:hypothetical protein
MDYDENEPDFEEERDFGFEEEEEPDIEEPEKQKEIDTDLQEAFDIEVEKQKQKQIDEHIVLDQINSSKIENDISKRLKKLYSRLNPQKHYYKQVLVPKQEHFVPKLTEEYLKLHPKDTAHGLSRKTIENILSTDIEKESRDLRKEIENAVKIGFLKPGRSREEIEKNILLSVKDIFKNFVVKFLPSKDDLEKNSVKAVKTVFKKGVFSRDALEKEVIKVIKKIFSKYLSDIKGETGFLKPVRKIREPKSKISLKEYPPLIETLPFDKPEREVIKQSKNILYEKIREIVLIEMNLIPKIVPKVQFEQPRKEVTLFSKNINLIRSNFVRKNVEFEVSFGYYYNETSFSPFISPFVFSIVRNYFDDNLSDFTRTNYADMVKIDNNINVREISSGKKVVYEHKSREISIDDAVWGVRANVSTERKLRTCPENFNPTVTRERQRFSYQCTNKDIIFFGTRVDLSVIHSRERNSFELEIEKISNDISVEQFLLAVKKLITITQNSVNDTLVLSFLDKSRIVIEHNELFGVKQDKLVQYQINPINIQNRYIVDRKVNYYPTIKYDGLRSYLYISSNGIYLIFHPYDIIKISGVGSKRYNGTLIDGEYLTVYTDNGYSKQYFAFDILFLSRDDVRNQRFRDRYNKMIFAIKQINSLTTEYILESKKYFIDTNFFTSAEKAIDEYQKMARENSDIPVDGLIFQPDSALDKDNDVYKWKPVNKLTIDFLVKKVKPGQFQLFVNDDKNKLVPFKGNSNNPFSSFIKVPEEYDNIQINNFVVECYYQNYTFSISRIRFDKSKPNFTTVAQSVWKDIHRNVLINTLTGKNAVLMRVYHNNSKNELIQTQSIKNGITVDVGSGRGGDLIKWKLTDPTHKPSKIYAIEPNREFIDEFKKRYSALYKSTDTPIVELVERSFLDIQLTDKVNVLFFFFSLTFFTETEEMYKQLLIKIDSLSSSKTKIVGIVLDKTLVLEEMKGREKISGSCFEIEKIEFNNTDFGNKIHVKIKDEDSMVNYDEYLFSTDRFFRDLEKLKFTRVRIRTLGDLETEDTSTFTEFENLSSCEQRLSIMYKYFIFQKK